ncbi:oocyte zinc finger protein XlCOF6-like isoform X3 [Bradysia coprophila]|uniref:oocyte zinc finger protein XlCOF6-like isoform X3 n=1 Tax=Bradysia coprophila TaxID=38358 RepID=UPI00187D7117|nr:oocyte zinc finger protein XlCOF6-like isoform X3 [Bradysia coprophila]
MDNHQIKAEPPDDKSTVNIEFPDDVTGVKVDPSAAVIIDGSAVYIKSEVTFGEYEYTPAAPAVSSSVAEIKLRNIEELLDTDPSQPKDQSRNEFKCTRCGQCFDQKPALKRHVKWHLRPFKVVEEGFPCEICGLKFLHESTAIKHKTLHTGEPLGEKELDCKVCGKVFKNRTKLRYHQQEVHGEKSVMCDICGKTFKSKNAIPNHMKIHFDEKTWECEYCGKRFIQKSAFKTHQATHREKPFHCDECDAKFSTKESLHSHKLKHLDPYVCDTCGKGYTSTKSLNNHKISHEIKSHLCVECGASFIRKYDLTVHQRVVHRKEKRFSCDECGMLFSSKTSLTNHKVRHTGAKPFSCGDCGKTFGYKAALENHRLTHMEISDDKKFSCDDCGMKFSFKHVLQKHKARHSGDKPFICVQCGMGFAAKSGLDSHKLTHSGEKPFSCEECSSAFTTKSLLHQHKRSHRQKKPEDQEKPFDCDLCGSKFSARSSLYRHRRDHHNKNSLTGAGKSKIVSQTTGAEDNKNSTTNAGKSKIVSETPQPPCAEDSNSEDNCWKFSETFSRTIDRPISDDWFSDGIRFGEEQKTKPVTIAEGLRPYHERNEKTAIQPAQIQKAIVEKDVEKKLKKPAVKYKRRPKIVEKPFACGVCDEKFSSQTRFKHHRLIHEPGQNKYCCDKCGKTYRLHHSFQHHRRWHEGIKNFICDICGFKCQHKVHMKMHLLRHVGDRSVCCDECPARFVENSGLQSHKRHVHRT